MPSANATSARRGPASAAATAAVSIASRAAPSTASTCPPVSTSATGSAWSTVSNRSTPRSPVPSAIARASALPRSIVRASSAWRADACRSAIACEIAVNGTSIGSVRSTSSCAAHAAISSGGASGRSASRPNISPHAAVEASRATYVAGSVASSQTPLVSTSSSSRMYGRGSASSVTCTQRTSRSSRSAPHSTRRPNSLRATRSRTRVMSVSTHIRRRPVWSIAHSRGRRAGDSLPVTYSR